MQLTVSLLPPTPIHPSRDVFDSLEIWLTSPDIAFPSWLNQQPLKKTSKTVYNSMFRKWIAWLKLHGIRINHVDENHLREFLDSEKLTKHHRQRYVRLIEQAFNHMARIGYAGINPGTRAGKRRIGEGENDPMRFLDSAERKMLVALIEKRTEKYREDQNWIEMRDTALVAAMFGGGLRVSQAQAVTVNCMSIQEQWISLRGERRDRPHRARLLPFANEALIAWLKLRRTLKLRSDLLFPAQRSAGGYKPKRATEKMHAASVYRRAERLMTEAGIQGNRVCAQTLRNTYAAMLIEQGINDDLIIEYMGFFKICTAQRLREAHEEWANGKDVNKS